MGNMMIENCVQIASALVLMLIGVLGTWLTAKIGRRAELTNISLALDELIRAVTCTVAQLQQTTVDGLKEAAVDGKLSQEEIRRLGIQLYDGALRKLSPAALQILHAAGADLSELIHGIGEAYVRKLAGEKR